MSETLKKIKSQNAALETSRAEHSWYVMPINDLYTHFNVQRYVGLNQETVDYRLKQFGPNRLREAKQETLLRVFLEEIREPMILLLLVTGLLYSVWGNLADALTIFFVILVLVSVEVINEYRAKRAIAGLSKLSEPTATVRRDGQDNEVPVEEIVPGDIILVWAGRRVPADARLIESYSLAANESSLTGESVPVEKDVHFLPSEHTVQAEQQNMIFAGTTITRGRGTALVVTTGMQTELGHIAGLAQEIRQPRTPLQQAMRELTRWLVWLALGFSILIPLLAILLSGEPWRKMLLTGLSLAFAVIPEELPIIITMVLALGAYRLARQQAIIKRLQAVETLGSVTTIATDKTGTLTENRMQVSQYYPETLEHELLEIGVLCNSAIDQGENLTGDPLEVALLRKAQEAGIHIDTLLQTAFLRDEFTFDNTRKRMSVVYDRDGALWVAVKGAPEAVLTQCTSRLFKGQEQPFNAADREAALENSTQMAGSGLRVIALAEKSVPAGPLSQDEAESDLTFIGFIGLIDPPRPEVRAAIAACRTAGIRSIMITGDHPLTARTIAEQVGLNGNAPMLTGPELEALSDEELKKSVSEVSIYARTTPAHKLRIVHALQEQGERVAVTGDGINDAPALAAADIGVAMGETGTDVAREAADMVLGNDNFTTIVNAVKEGRILFANLKKGVRYYLACKVALVSATLLPVLLHVPVPFAPIQIILMELFMDLAASATFVNEPAEADLMRYPPRNPNAHFMDRAMVSSIFSSAIGLFMAVTTTYLVTWYTSGDLVEAQTVAFITWLLGHIFLAVNLRSEREPLFRLGLFSNRLMIIWGVATVIFILFATFIPGIQNLLKTVSLTPEEWILVIGIAFIGTFWIEVLKLLHWRNKSNKHNKQQM